MHIFYLSLFFVQIKSKCLEMNYKYLVVNKKSILLDNSIKGTAN